MSSKKPLKIKVLPKTSKTAPEKGTEKIPSSKSSKKKRVSKNRSKDGGFWSKFFLVLVIFAAAAALLLVNSREKPSSSSVPSAQKNLRNEDRKLSRYLQDAHKKSELKRLEVEVENHRALGEELPAFLPLEGSSSDSRPLGVELDSDPAMNNIYEDLYGNNSQGKWLSPEERISARLAERKWLHNYEKEERKVYIRNFIQAAREAGYELEINEDLIVTRVRPITNRPKVPLDKIIENLNSSQ